VGRRYSVDLWERIVRAVAAGHSRGAAEQPPGGAVQSRPGTLKERVIHGRVHRNLDESRNAVRQFLDRYNAQRPVEKNGFPSPNQAKEQGNAAT